MIIESIFYRIIFIASAVGTLFTPLWGTSPSLRTKPVQIIVFIHGITSARPHLGISNIFRFIHDNVENTPYAQAVHRVRKDQFCFHGQAMQDYGLRFVNIHATENKSSAQVIAQLFDTVHYYTDKNSQMLNHYYTYGWSALLSRRERKKAAHHLYHQLVALQKHYRARGIQTKIRIIGYSHGGNVALALGSLPHYYAHTLTIDEVITLGMPVHPEEHHWIHHPFFKQVYHMYSHSDCIQRLDIFTQPGHLSHKYFTHQKNLALPSYLKQIKIKTTRPSRGSVCNKSACYAKPSIFYGKGRTMRDASPGHIELWFFGWAAEFYQKNVILYPLPYVILVPLLLHHINNYPITHTDQSFIVDIRPYDERMIIRNIHSPQTAHIAPFLPLSTIERLKERARNAKPYTYSRKRYAERINTLNKMQ